MEGFSTSGDIESVRSWAGQVDIRSYRGKNREGGALGGTHVGASGVWGGGQSKSDEDRMSMREHQPAAGIPGTEALPGGRSDSPVAAGLITRDLPLNPVRKSP